MTLGDEYATHADLQELRLELRAEETRRRISRPPSDCGAPSTPTGCHRADGGRGAGAGAGAGARVLVGSEAHMAVVVGELSDA